MGHSTEMLQFIFHIPNHNFKPLKYIVIDFALHVLDFSMKNIQHQIFNLDLKLIKIMHTIVANSVNLVPRFNL